MLYQTDPYQNDVESDSKSGIIAGQDRQTSSPMPDLKHWPARREQDRRRQTQVNGEQRSKHGKTKETNMPMRCANLYASLAMPRYVPLFSPTLTYHKRTLPTP